MKPPKPLNPTDPLNHPLYKDHPLEGCVVHSFKGCLLYVPAALFWAGLLYTSWNSRPGSFADDIYCHSYKASGSMGSTFNLLFYGIRDGVIYEGPTINGWGLKAEYSDVNTDGVTDLIVTDNRGGRLVFLVARTFSKSAPIFTLTESKGSSIYYWGPMNGEPMGAP